MEARGGGGGVRGRCLTEAGSHDALVFFLFFLALVAILFSRAGWFEQFGRGSPKDTLD